MSETEFAILIFGFASYYFIERCLQIILIAYQPSFYDRIRASRKDLVFFGIWMGMLISAFSSPFCAYGARNALFSWRNFAAADGQQGEGWPLDPHSKICVASRAILWVSELNRLDLYGLYVIHHAGSIVSLLLFVFFKWPTVLYLTLYATLVSEIPGDMIWMLSSYLDVADRVPSALVWFKYHLVRFNIFQYTLIRGTGIFLVSWMLITNSPGLQGRSGLEQTCSYATLGLYTLFCASYVFRQYRSIQIPSPPEPTETERHGLNRKSEPPHLAARPRYRSCITFRIPFGSSPTIIFVPYGLFMGFGFAALVFTSLTIGVPLDQDRGRLWSALHLCLVFAVIFARLLSIFMEDGVAKLITQPLRAVFRPGFWLHGGVFGAAVGGLISYYRGDVQDFPMFAGSLAVGLPLYETFSRIGCHTYGCCYGQVVGPATAMSSDRVNPTPILWHILPYPVVRYNHPTLYAATRSNPKLVHEPLIPIQLISATLFLLLFLCVSLPLTYHTRVEVAGPATLICHTVIRLITERYRADFRGEIRWKLSTTGGIALVQAVGAISWLAGTLLSEENLSTPPMDWDWSGIEQRALSSIPAALLGIVVYGIHIGEIGSWTGETVGVSVKPIPKA